MGRRGKSKATVASEQKEKMRRRRDQNVFVELAPLGEEKLLARRLASPREKNPSNAQGLAPPLGSLSIPSRDMPPSSDSPPWVCTPPRVPSPEGVAGQSKLVEKTCDNVTSIMNSLQKMHEYKAETNTEYIAETNTEYIAETNTELNTESNFDKYTENFDIYTSEGQSKLVGDTYESITSTIETKQKMQELEIENMTNENASLTTGNENLTTEIHTLFFRKENTQSEIESMITELHCEQMNFDNESIETEIDIFKNTPTSDMNSICNIECFIGANEIESSSMDINLEHTADIELKSTQPVRYSQINTSQVCQELAQEHKNTQNSLVLKGSFHQGNVRFGNNAGKQCVANCLVALIHSKLVPVPNWISTTLDTILEQGNDLYTWIHGVNDLLLVSDLPLQVEVNNMLVNIQMNESIAAMYDREKNIDFSNFPGALPLDEAIQASLIENDGCFICVQGSTSLVIKQENKLYLFDSHARNECGLPAFNGSSIVLQIQNVDRLYHHLVTFIKHNSSVQFELTGVKVALPLLHSIESSVQHDCSYRPHMAGDRKPNTEQIHQETCETDSVMVDIEDTHRFDRVEHKDLELDIQIISSSKAGQFDFKPADVKLRKKLCAVLKIPSKHVSKSGNCSPVLSMGSPQYTKEIHGDGNCLFRALSFAISQRQEFYAKVREAIVQHTLNNADKFVSFVESPSVEEHIASTKMTENNSWGTALEIIAAADLLKTDIFTFTDEKWVRYSAHQIDKHCIVNEKAIYLRHSNSHYEVVLSVLPNTGIVRDKVMSKRKVSELLTENNGAPSAKLRKRENEKNRYHSSDTFRQRKNDEVKIKYQTNTQFRENLKKKGITKYHSDDQYRNDLIEKGIAKYKNDDQYRENLIQTGIAKYKNDDQYRENLIQTGIAKYKNDDQYRENLIQMGITKYQNDNQYRQHLIDCSKERYSSDLKFMEKKKADSKNKYWTDKDHRDEKKAVSKKRYESDSKHKENKSEATSKRRQKKREENKVIDKVVNNFRVESKKAPDYVCCCCFRLLFEKQVILCKKELYADISEEVGGLSELCISEKYWHTCTGTNVCDSGCIYSESRKDLWICYNCHRKITKGKIPAECFINNLELEEVPKQLNCLNSLEQHLVALNIPFMKILGLPAGGQKGVHGPVISVPSDISKVTSTLPRCNDENMMLRVKLKRKLSYKGYEQYQFVNTKHLEEALSFLKRNNEWYSEVNIDKTWLNPIQEESTVDGVNLSNNDEAESSNENDNKQVDNELSDSYLDERLRGLQLDTSLQPADIGQEVLDLYFDQVFNVSPAENNKPVSILQEKGLEAKSFPAHYPSGKNTYDEEREEKLSLLRYFNLRLLSVENRFARDTSYIFFSQYMAELDRVMSNVQISLRKESVYGSDGKKVTSSMLCDKDKLKELFKNDEAIKYLKPVRGTPPYWQATQKELFAMLYQLGIPTFFCSFSAADFRWTEITEAIMKQQGFTTTKTNIHELDWNEKCKILRENPVTVARMFEHRWHTFLYEVILSPAEPIGKVIDWFYRVEFQQRGSPHTHCLFWVEGAPKLGEDSDEDVIAFIDKYITCTMPDEENDPELHEMVNTLHQHSKNHSKSCRKKKGTVCRFNFPRPPSEKTFIARPNESQDENFNDLNAKSAKERVATLFEVMSTNGNLSISEVFEKANMSQEEFQEIFSSVSKRTTVVLKRDPEEIWTNQYNADLLRSWNANMDIQFITDAYGCIVYVIDYISKAEGELGMFLKQTLIEAQEGNLSAQQTMKKIGTAYLHNREISAQEAIFRVTGLKLRECSRKIEFIPVGDNPCRLSKPLKDLEKQKQKLSKAKNDDENDIDEESQWMTNIVDRYKERPKTEDFETMCCAEFRSDFTVLAKSQVPKKINENTTFKLGKDLGYIRRRTRTQPAVIRHARFSVEKQPEKYYQSMLQLYLPYRTDSQLKPAKFETHQEFYEQGCIRLNGELKRVKAVVDNNKVKFVKNEKAIADAEIILEEHGSFEDAWGCLCPQTETERRQCLEEGTTATVVEEELPEASIPDLNENSRSTNLVSRSVNINDVLPLLRSLNHKQKKVLYKVRDWCLKKTNGEVVNPFHVFITGGGGTGKSHLIKCLFAETTRILARTTPRPDDITVLLTAPTGTAAFNINGSTIHSALKIQSLSSNQAILSEDKINTLRSNLDQLQILIIDEISMVNKQLLFMIHSRLRQLKKTKESTLFGGVSVIAVGDFYQLPPVRTSKKGKLFVNDPSSPINHLWNELFSVVELNEVMRQRDDGDLVQLLNRLRVRTKAEKIEQRDLRALKECMTDGSESSLHIFATNEECKSYNNEMVMKVCTGVKLIEAEDYAKVKPSGKLVRQQSNFSGKGLNISLQQSILIGNKARVMLIKNIDIQDGLVNGAMGTVKELSESQTNSLPKVIFVHFDNKLVGRNAKLKKVIDHQLCIGIEPYTEDLTDRHGCRKQFPLQLAWACTIHKVQGLTVNECVVDLSKCFSSGQAYVALSRVTSKAGLHVCELDERTLEKKIYSDSDVADGISSMAPYLEDDEGPGNNTNKLSFMYHNIQGLLFHREDLQYNTDFKDADYICLTETWLQSRLDSVELEGYQLTHLPRSSAFDTNDPLFVSLREMSHGGVAVFHKTGGDFIDLGHCVFNLECLVFKVAHLNLVVIVTYRTQKYPVRTFIDNFISLLQKVAIYSDKIIVVGDFNQDILKGEKGISEIMRLQGFQQLVQQSTTEGGTLIDHVYVKGCHVDVTVKPTYYSYHDSIEITLTRE